uniref:Uncharacterized protein n=1 Tax=Anguilla anguilla TaxID=7936 RepID=A0A0E9RGP2_ANGAN
MSLLLLSALPLCLHDVTGSAVSFDSGQLPCNSNR